MNEKDNKKSKKISKKEKERIRREYKIEVIIVIILFVFLLILLCNRTFFREQYKTSKISLDIPIFSFFVKDDGKILELKTLRKSQYVKKYFEDYLSTLTRYNCKNKIFYYVESTNTIIYDINVEKDFALKTITIKYDNKNPDLICDSE